MKRMALFIILCAFFTSAQATTSIVNLTIKNKSEIEFYGYDGQPKTITGSEDDGYFGYLNAKVKGTFYVTYLGNESAYVNSFSLTSGTGAGQSLLESNSVGTTISSLVGPGKIGFNFKDDHGATFSNGDTQKSVLGFAIMPGQTKSQGTFDYILGFNDSYKGPADYDDFVVGVRFVKFVTPPVPEAETYSMMLMGLGLMGFMIKRRKQA